ncbi:GreA/GreB family elongation factor [Symmachiella dynata]|uniref:Transcription elongation factor GreA n=1 Tax=Symmachiella dynata TaxID=2527995 RepID=A0A517ZXW4_9PLAN|nr:GreA/GreB family elongation factor [Symmachiella dynata]QDT51623.1 Transcription elongation factor GreA [Symmachiella dynata]QDU47322.1 Transcription elongation factor GreA [Symmachiella dynata]
MHENSDSVVDVGNWVNLTGFEPGAEEEKIYIVDDAAAQPAELKVGKSSPLAQALLGKQVGDEFSFQTPAGNVQLTVTATGQP